MSDSSPKRYHPVHVTIHWLMALFVIMLIGVGKFMMPGMSPEDPQKVMILQIHAYFGMALGILLVIRLVLRFAINRPAPADAGNSFLNFVAKAVHFLLYFFVIAMAFSGFGLFKLADLPSVFNGASSYPSDFFVFPVRMGHGLFSWILLALILLHVAAAMYHQFFRKDNLLSRMWFGK